jgi:hypothetical protein
MRFLRFLPLLLMPGALLASGCQASCDRWCDNTADYIEYCMANASQGEWSTIAAGESWGAWGFSSKDEYASGCKEDMGARLGGDDTDALESTCEDEANRFGELFERGTCAEVP